MIFLYIVGVGASLQLGSLILDFGRGVNGASRTSGANFRCERARKACKRKRTSRKTMIKGVQVQLLCSRDPSSVRSRSFESASFGSPGRNEFLGCLKLFEQSFLRYVRAAAPELLAATFFGSFAFFSVTLLTGLCAGSPVDTVCADFARGLSAICLTSVIDDSSASMSKLTVLDCGQRCRQRC